jgi:phosphate-selective porin
MSYKKPLAFIKFIIRNFSYLLGVVAAVHSGNGQNSSYDEIWDKVVLYENEENSWISKFWLTGRLQGEYHSFENEISPALDHDDYDWRRFRFGFKATFWGDITLHSEADLGLENEGRPLYNDLTDTYFSWSTDNGIKFKVGKTISSFYIGRLDIL